MNASAEPRHAIVPESAAGRRLDAVVAELFPEYSRSRLSAWIKSGDVSVDGAPARGRDPVRGGEQVALNVVQETQTHAVAEDIPLDVLYEDEHVFVIDKPAGLVVHPGAGNPAGTLVNALLFRDPALELLPRAGIVHRLDKDTSGVMVVARTLTAHTALVEQLSNRQVHRQYLAVVVGALVSGGTANAAIDRHPRDRLRMAVREDGKDAVTHYRLRERFRAHTALECRLETGRTHQIRVHMQHLKHPIVGDPLYGGSFKLPKGASEELIAALRAFKRQALHAEVLEFMHPASGEPIRCSAPLPADMQQLLALLRADAAAHAEAERARR
ncbi:23S rRNA pseudouridine(1911/1915/1917) synthase RluD [Thermomonas sp.]|jgi:23S rRNA pseudouridine1911/1915/1917 synthase|uniref:23S rRNA pseudouridine(1911/1915/1917) synthase RluD n=1 Tax=Thermomonas sp. TaxID=1971895 RepID=UPI001B662AB4|nr:23S rRNA pseudouridine(1911/1915/1917) synthase RluD [Thermomonas sp.]MBK6333581.1 23S rRNA pseudouridine(1911/1915/1917) synthase RluD [Thermomonas sp.]MBK6416203.1 23S rRNA pseudouridine(1911/1915/1917) synthase RluD [Thermomonas sp.]MBK6925356.1 23S rRNA pseudouridine(1911/1915/1917) synthase RluD [Thermomonas sp.]MBK7205283.1 23S rRNA pseudouridine(1911/1915/1917) synthase RluD [Thermomonas sp.]MBK9669518.1 23S rRNA pseudouridine(1911/1915/1917) synthase RluD [Thermomonas sp.]